MDKILFLELLPDNLGPESGGAFRWNTCENCQIGIGCLVYKICTLVSSHVLPMGFKTYQSSMKKLQCLQFSWNAGMGYLDLCQCGKAAVCILNSPSSAQLQEFTGTEVLSSNLCCFIYLLPPPPFFFLDQLSLPRLKSFGEDCNLHFG